MKLKTFFACLLVLALTLSLAACVTPIPAPGEKTAVRVAALSGSTGLGMVKLMADQAAGTTKNDYTFTVFDNPETLIPEISSKKFDIAALPTNVAAKLYNKTNGEIRMLAVNTLGVLYVLEIGTKTVTSVGDLKGKTIYTFGQGATPEYALKYILEKNNLVPGTDVQIEFAADANAVIAQAKPGAILMIPEPAVTAAKGSVDNVNVVLDVTAEWNKVCDTPMAQGCVVVTKDFAEKNPAAVDAFLKEYEASINYVRDNAEEASELVATYKIMPKAALAKKAIPNCNLKFLAGAEMKATLAPFYQVLFNANAASIGGKLPGNDFYYGK